MIRQFFTTYKRLTVFVGLVAILCFAAVPIASAQVSKEAVCQGVGYVAGSGDQCQPVDNGRTVEQTVKNIVDILSWVVGVASVLMIIVGGLRYVLSGGDSNNVTAAKNTILYALVGLVVVMVAQILVNLVIGFVTS